MLSFVACASTPAANTSDKAGTGTSTVAAPKKIEKREVIMMARPSGASITTYEADGSISFDYHHVQNGRGPKYRSKMRLAPDGTVAFYEARGVQEMLSPIEENFVVEGTTAKWKSLEENGQAELSAPAFYAPLYSPVEIAGFLLAAAQKAGGKIALLPGAEAVFEREEEVSVKNAAGEEKKLVTWAMTGFDVAELRFFTEPDGAFFGYVSRWYSVVPEGWSAVIEPLVALTEKLERQRDKTIAENLTKKIPDAGLAIINGRVYDSVKQKMVADQTVIVQKGKIVAVGPAKSTKVPKGAQILDAKNKTVLPGLWDMHTHIGATAGRIDIAAGVTTARDLANDPDSLADLKKRWTEGTAIGPNLLRSGFIEGRGEFAAASKITAVTEEEAKAAVEFYAKEGYEGIKIYNSIKPELVPLLAKLAHEKKMRVSGHIPAFMLAEDAVRAGYDEIHHINMVFLNFLADRTTDTRTPLRFSLVGDKAPDLDLSSKAVQDFVKLLLEKKTVVDPTINAIGTLYIAKQGEVPPGSEELVARLPIQTQRGFKTGGLPVPKEDPTRYQRAYKKVLEMTKMLHDAGVPLVAGTDAFPGLVLHREIEVYVEAGLTPAQALHTATLGAAKVMKRDASSGSIAKGKDADIILVDGDPLANIKDIRKVVTVVKGSSLYDSAQVYATVGIRPAS
jgi:hypothetical protein